MYVSTSADLLAEDRFSPLAAAKLLGCSKKTIYRALWSGHLRYVRLGRCWVIPRSALVAWLENGGQTAPKKRREWRSRA